MSEVTRISTKTVTISTEKLVIVKEGYFAGNAFTTYILCDNMYLVVAKQESIDNVYIFTGSIEQIGTIFVNLDVPDMD